MPTPTQELRSLDPVITFVNVTTDQIISTNSSLVPESLAGDKADTETVIDPEYWPNWVQRVMCVSHLCLTFNSSVNFYTYYIKRSALNSGILLIAAMLCTTKHDLQLYFSAGKFIIMYLTQFFRF